MTCVQRDAMPVAIGYHSAHEVPVDGLDMLLVPNALLVGRVSARRVVGPGIPFVRLFCHSLLRSQNAWAALVGHLSRVLPLARRATRAFQPLLPTFGSALPTAMT